MKSFRVILSLFLLAAYLLVVFVNSFWRLLPGFPALTNTYSVSLWWQLLGFSLFLFCLLYWLKSGLVKPLIVSVLVLFVSPILSFHILISNSANELTARITPFYENTMSYDELDIVKKETGVININQSQLKIYTVFLGDSRIFESELFAMGNCMIQNNSDCVKAYYSLP